MNLLFSILLAMAVAPQNYDSEEIEREADAAAEEVEVTLERQIRIRDGRLSLCKRSVNNGAIRYFPDNVDQGLEKDPELGPYEVLHQICAAYLHGRRDELRESIREQEELLESIGA